jgi:GMP synthase-like glutamine amidotransferase
MKRAIVLTHAAFEGPAKLSPLLAGSGYTVEVRQLHRGDLVPDGMSSNDLLVVMGGPMGVGDLERPEFPFLRAEVRLLARCLEEDAAVLGVCLGAQLLAYAAGATVRPMTREDGERCYEVGWAPVRFHRTDERDPILRDLPAEAQALHWHGDMFELPVRARLLASTPTCPNQAFQIGSRMFGLQFHCEVGVENVEDFLRTDAHFVERTLGPGGAERVREDTRRHLASSWAIGERLLRNILRSVVDD